MNKIDGTYRTWVEIDLKKIENNIEILKKIIEPSKIICVVKANAYGHDDVIITRKLIAQGISFFAVSNIDEALRIRSVSSNIRILILGYTPPDLVNILIKHNIEQTIVSKQHAMCLQNAIQDGTLNIHVALDSGMHRIGEVDVKQLFEILDTNYKNLAINSIFTHLSVADSDIESDIDFTKQQIKTIETIKEKRPTIKIHYLNSAGILRYPIGSSDYVRPGIILYGLSPNYPTINDKRFKPVMQFKTRIVHIKKLKRGSPIGYGRSYYTNDESIIATICVGYADGYPRSLSNKFYVLVNGQRAPIVGKVCMDQTMIDITNIPHVQIGTIVTLVGSDGDETITFDVIAQHCNTIGYEIICNISPRVPRIIVK